MSDATEEAPDSKDTDHPTCDTCGKPMKGGAREGSYRRWYCDRHPLPLEIHYTTAGDR